MALVPLSSRFAGAAGRSPSPLWIAPLVAIVLAGCGGDGDASAEPPPEPLSVHDAVVVTFNTGTAGSIGAASDADGYGPDQAELSDLYYGNGLAWLELVEDTRRFFAALDPDVVFFQEIFHPGDCETIPPEAHGGFICERWRPGDPTVAQEVLGDGWQVACHLGKPDKCAAVHERFGRFVGCDTALCLDGLDGGTVPDCGSGSRVGRGVIERVDGSRLTLVSIHGSSGIEQADQDCRVRQFGQVFDDLGDGSPAANGEHNLVAGDLNTDPGRMFDFDESAAYFADQAAAAGLAFHSEVGMDATPTYGGLFNIDHVLSDDYEGTCVVPGVTEGWAPVTTANFFDHKPIVCRLDRVP